MLDGYISPNKNQAVITITPQNPSVIVLSAKSEARLKEYAEQLLAFINNQATIASKSDHNDPYKQLLKDLCRIASEVVGMPTEEIDLESDLHGQGFDPVQSATLINQINKSYNLDLTQDLLTSNPTIKSLSQYLWDNFQDQINMSRGKEDQSADDLYSLADIAYTLQTGREAMDVRLALLVDSIDALKEKLCCFINGKDNIEDLYYGQVKRSKEALSIFTADEELQAVIDKWIQHRKFRKLLDLWVKGLVFDWAKLYGAIKPHRISLPTYPFARKRYWLPNRNIKTGNKNTKTTLIVRKHSMPANNDKYKNDRAGYEKLLDKMIEDSISIEDAVKKAERLIVETIK